MVRIAENHPQISLLKRLASQNRVKFYIVRVDGVRSVQFCTDSKGDTKLSSWLKSH